MPWEMPISDCVLHGVCDVVGFLLMMLGGMGVGAQCCNSAGAIRYLEGRRQIDADLDQHRRISNT